MKKISHKAFVILLFALLCNTEAKSQLKGVPGATTKWIVNEQNDVKVHRKLYFGNILANEPVTYKSGSAIAEIIIRNKNGINEAIFRVDKGHFKHNASKADIKARFDREKPVVYHCTISEEVLNNLVITDANQFISKLKTSKKLTIEASFENEGNKSIKFDVEGLKWDH